MELSHWKCSGVLQSIVIVLATCTCLCRYFPPYPKKPSTMSDAVYRKVKLTLYHTFWEKVLEGVKHYEKGELTVALEHACATVTH